MPASDRAALGAFTQLTEAALYATTLQQVARQAVEVLQRYIPELSVAFYILHDERWVGDVLSENVAPETAQVLRAGLPFGTPAFADALSRRGVVFADGWHGQEQGIAQSAQYGAAAFYPHFRDGLPYALLAIGSTRTQRWDAYTRKLFTATGHSLDLACQRLATSQRQELERQALNIFATFTEAASRIEDLDDLILSAFGTLGTLFPGCSLVFYEWRDDLWKARQLAGDLAPELAAAVRAGLPASTPVFVQMQQALRGVFMDGWSADREGIHNAEQHQTVMVYPVEQGGAVVAALTMSLPQAPCWTPEDRAVASAVGRSFSLLYDRVAAVQALSKQEAEARSRVQALEAFAVLTGEFSVQQDPHQLIRRAQEVVLGLLPPGHSIYWEPEQDRWRMQVLTNQLGDGDLQLALEAGMPLGHTPTLDTPWQTGEPFYQDEYRGGTDLPEGLTLHLRSVAALPVWQDQRRRGVINFATFEPYSWKSADRVVLTTVMQNLTLALERAESISQLRQRTEALEASNAELEAFTYSASHDLRTPVRHIQGFNDLALRSIADPSEKTSRYMQVVQTSAGRLNAIIDSMLLLSRAGRVELQREPVLLDELVAQAQQDAELEFPGREISWQVSPLPVVTGDHQTLQQVMTNLLGNAVKYSRLSPSTEVAVWAEETAGSWTVFVRDRGAGFDPAYRHKLFGVFQRLHTDAQFAGTGIGLATVKRIVQRHGGAVFAEGAPGQGATFGFTLPKP